MTFLLGSLFAEQAAKSPGQVALRFGQNQLTYAELDQRSNQLAHYLQQQGVQPDTLVGVCIERSLDMIVAVLGILKSGAAYLPLDASYPTDRLSYMLDNAKVKLVLTQTSLLPLVQQISQGMPLQALVLQDLCHAVDKQPNTLPRTTTSAENLAYVIYTSGSTGMPKGVAIMHGTVVNLMRWHQQGKGDHAVLAKPAKMLQFAPLGFDASVPEIFGTLVTGGTLVLIDNELRLDTARLLNFLCEEGIERINVPFVALQALSQAASQNPSTLWPKTLHTVVSAGEALVVTPDLVRCFETVPGSVLFNQYGPTETTVMCTSCTLTGSPKDWPVKPTIGHALPHAKTYLLDEALQPVALGQEGELYVGGACLAQSYLHRPDLTAQRFIPNPIADTDAPLLYKTGDLLRQLPNGEYEYVGRIDDQVKIRGYRVELGEIEAVLNLHEAVNQAVVTARADNSGVKRLIAYIKLNRSDVLPLRDLRQHVETRLPDFMMPALFMTVEDFPRSPAGKIDRRALPEPSQARPNLEVPFVAPQHPKEVILCEVMSTLLGINPVGVDDNFFDLGGNSILALRLTNQLAQVHHIDLPVANIFQYATARQLAALIDQDTLNTPEARLREKLSQQSLPRAETDAVAIIGMAGRFPGALSVTELWDVLLEGKETTSFFSLAELDPTIPESLKRDPHFVAAHGEIPDADKFDAAFFGITPRQAAIMDPQHRIFLETAWHALEDAGYGNPSGQSIGVFAGTHTNTYYHHNVRSRPDEIEVMGLTAAELGNEKDFVATQVAYQFNLTGPAIAIHTACSTSLVAVVQGVFALLTGQCKMALAGGVSVAAQQKKGYLYQEGSMLSRDGHCRPFDAQAAGTVFSDGAGAVVLKRLSDAVAEGDSIYAVIRGAAINNDGADKMSFSAPNIEGQASVVAMAQQMANVDPRSIAYIEAHGTATPLGDPIEVAALTQAFRARATQSENTDSPWCVLGSIKSNFGHLTAAAGVTGLIKAAKSVQLGVIPGTVHYQESNPNIQFANSPFAVSAKNLPWPSDQAVRRAGVSSFGVGGTNAHVVIEESPPTAQATHRSARPWQVVLISTKNSHALERQATNLLNWLKANPHASLADAAYTLQIGRTHFAYRRAIAAQDVNTATQTLAAQSGRSVQVSKPKRLVFMFAGQGSQSLHMARALYETEAVFRQTVDQCHHILQQRFGIHLIQLIYPNGDFDKQDLSEKLRDTAITQPALFVVEYALAKLLMSWGLKPNAMLGHSIGEFVAACLAEVFSLEDALYLIGLRGKLMSALPTGKMLSVRAHPDQITDLIESCELDVAAINGPQLCVVAGAEKNIVMFSHALETKGIVSKSLMTSHAFHSRMMQPMLAEFRIALEAVKIHAPKIPILSTVNHCWLDDATIQSTDYWVQHARATVNFSGAIGKLLAETQADNILLEVSPRQTLTVLVRQQIREQQRCVSIPLLSDPGSEDKSAHELMAKDHQSIQQALAQLWMQGVSIDWPAYHAGYKRYRVSLPGYAFDRTRHWLEPGMSTSAPLPLTRSTNLNLTSISEENVTMSASTTSAEKHIPTLREIFEDLSGQELSGFDNHTTFLEMGLDSLLLTQIERGINKQFGTKITFRQLQEGQSSFAELAKWVQSQLPPEPIIQSPVNVIQNSPSTVINTSSASPSALSDGSASTINLPASAPFIEQVIAQQMMLMNQQMALLRGTPAVQATATINPVPAANSIVTAKVESGQQVPAIQDPQAMSPASPEAPKPAVPFGAQARISLNRDALSAQQQNGLQKLITDYTKKTAKSKAHAQQHRDYMSDPRVVTGFKPLIKEAIYPIVVERSEGIRLWDLDGNEYIDMLCGFGSSLFGHGAPFITKALHEQLDKGIEVGPQTPLAGEAAALFAELTGQERVAFCNTGSEAVLGALRIARTVTGRDTVAVFSGSYHGIIDEVIIRGNKKLQPVPAASGIPFSNVQNMLVLDYGTPESLAILKERAHELAAILVEPVQSRRPDFRPVEFWKALRQLTLESGTVLIFDEVITGLRSHPQGVQGLFGVKADIATYGKVVGGGMSVGVVAGAKRFMDALDGGTWRFGDDSTPQAGVTYFAGTFVRHPLAVAAAKAVLQHLKAEGPSLQQKLNERGDQFAAEINAFFKEQNAPLFLKNFGSQMKLVFTEEYPLMELFYHHMRLRGVHIWDFPCFLTTAHTEQDIAFVTQTFKESVKAMQADGFFPLPLASTESASEVVARISAGVKTGVAQPPVPGARLGRAPDGTPAWFIPDPAKPGAYVRLADVTE